MAGRKPTAKRALPASFKDRTTKSGGGKTIKKSNTTTKTKTKSGGVKGVRPGDTSLPTALGTKNLGKTTKKKK